MYLSSTCGPVADQVVGMIDIFTHMCAIYHEIKAAGETCTVQKPLAIIGGKRFGALINVDRVYVSGQLQCTS